MAGSLFARLSLEEGGSAFSLEGLEMKLGGEGKSAVAYLRVLRADKRLAAR